MKKKKDLPPPRSKGKIEVTFSPRVFKTPSRESKAAEEQEVCNSQVVHSLTCTVTHNKMLGHQNGMENEIKVNEC